MEVLQTVSEYTISSGKPEEAHGLYEALEKPNWAPWLAASVEALAGRAKIFPDGQIVAKTPTGEYVGSLSLNQIEWDGDPSHLPSWDEVAGEPTDYSATYKSGGNTLVLMSMNISPDWKGKHVPSKLIAEVKKVAGELKATNIMGSFRPSGYGEAKKAFDYDIDFESYCHLTRVNSSKPVDPWLGSLWHAGMEMVAVDHEAMTVPVSIEEFLGYQQAYKPDMWKEISEDVWECGEVGQWNVDGQKGRATYQESNIWGRLPTHGDALR